MNLRLIAFAPLACATAACAVPTVAAANVGVGIGSLPLAVTAFALSEQSRCAVPARPAYGSPRLTETPAAGLSKSTAILGGQVSQLELMRLQQQAATTPPMQFASVALPGDGLVPRAGGIECSQFVLPQSDTAALRPGRGMVGLGTEDFLASKRLPVKRTSFDGQWNRVRRDSLPSRLTASLASLAPGGRPGEAMLSAVNAWANQRIRYVEDRELYGKADHWAGARTTLKRGAGDCEDIAIAKLQLLAAMGVPRSDMYLTIARDLARNADHAVLVVKLDGRHWLLDNNTDRLLDARDSYDYRPILSFSAERKWLHGY